MSLDSERMREVHPVASSPKHYWPYSLVVGITRLTGRGASAGTGIVACTEVHDHRRSAEGRSVDRLSRLFADAISIALILLTTDEGRLKTVAFATFFTGVQIHADIDRIETVRGRTRFADTVLAGVEHCAGHASTRYPASHHDRERVLIAEIAEARRRARGRHGSRSRRLGIARISCHLGACRGGQENDCSNRSHNQIFHDHSF